MFEAKSLTVNLQLLEQQRDRTFVKPSIYQVLALLSDTGDIEE